MDRGGSSACQWMEVEAAVAALTSGTFLLAFLVLLPLGQSAEGLGCLLEFGDKELDVIQDVVQDLLPKGKRPLLL